MTAATEGADAATTRSKGRFHVLMAVLLLVEMLSSLEHTMILSALPTLVREFHDITAVGWLVTGFLLAQAATAAVGGRLGDMFGRKWVLLILVALCAIGSLVSALGHNLESVILGRVIQGASGAILPLCYGITREEAPRGSAPLWIGVLTGGYAFAGVFGYVLGGYFADIGNWRLVFYMTAGYAALLIPLLLIVTPVKPLVKLSGRFDWLGAALFAPAIATALYGVTEAGTWGWTSPRTWAFVGGGLSVLAVWVWHERRCAEPLINVRLLGQREVALGNICGALASFGMMQLPIVTLMILQQPVLAGVGLGVSATIAGLLKLPSNATALVASPLSGFLAGKQGARRAVIQGAALGAVAWTGMLFFHHSVLQVVLASMACAFAAQMLLAAIPILVLEGSPPERSSEVTGMTSVFRSVASAMGAQTIAIALASSRVIDPASGADFPSERAYQLTFGMIAVTAALVAILALAGRGRSNPTAT